MEMCWNVGGWGGYLKGMCLWDKLVFICGGGWGGGSVFGWWGVGGVGYVGLGVWGRKGESWGCDFWGWWGILGGVGGGWFWLLGGREVVVLGVIECGLVVVGGDLGGGLVGLILILGLGVGCWVVLWGCVCFEELGGFFIDEVYGVWGRFGVSVVGGVGLGGEMDMGYCFGICCWGSVVGVWVGCFLCLIDVWGGGRLGGCGLEWGNCLFVLDVWGKGRGDRFRVYEGVKVGCVWFFGGGFWFGVGGGCVGVLGVWGLVFEFGGGVVGGLIGCYGWGGGLWGIGWGCEVEVWVIEKCKNWGWGGGSFVGVGCGGGWGCGGCVVRGGWVLLLKVWMGGVGGLGVGGLVGGGSGLCFVMFGVGWVIRVVELWGGFFGVVLGRGWGGVCGGLGVFLFLVRGVWYMGVGDVLPQNFDSYSSEVQKLICTADHLGALMQYDTPGFLPNKRIHRAMGLATLEVMQAMHRTWSNSKVRVNGKTRQMQWRDMFDIAVKWRRIADPDQPVLWLDQMPARSLSRGFNNHINLIRGQIINIRYLAYFDNILDFIKERILVYHGAYNPRGLQEVRHALENVNRVEDLLPIMKFNSKTRDGFTVNSKVQSVKDPGKEYDGFTITITGDRVGNMLFSVETQTTEERTQQYQSEIESIYKDLTAKGKALMLSTELGDADAVCNLILSLVYYFCNLMPLSRGSSVVAYSVVMGALMASGKEVTGKIPKGKLVDFEAMTTSNPSSFSKTSKMWMNLKSLPGWYQSLPSVAETFASSRTMIEVLNTDSSSHCPKKS
uniref:Uncharacterized protein n=1 Tax=Knipowitschia caucasica TaxID=637954 RepID=A0AAV2KDY1_KNICA